MPDLDPARVLRHTSRCDGPRSADCLDDGAIAALADGRLDDVTRVRALPHLADCARCRAAVASVTRLLSDPSVAGEVTRIGGRWRRLVRIAVPVTAAAIILLLVSPHGEVGVGPPHRAPTITAVSSPAPTSPVGIVARVTALRWGSVGGTDRYRATLFDQGGSVLYEIQTSDTVAILPDSVRLDPDRSYLWKVEARTGWGRWSASQLVEFSIR